jgi:hypothetical protein
VKVDVVIVDAFIAVLNVAVTVELMATLVVPLAGVAEVTVGAVGGRGGGDPPEFPQPLHAARTRDALTSHQPEWNRIIDFSMDRLDGEFALSNSRPG